MKKGLGAILAEVEMDQAKTRIEQGIAVICPLCDQEMEFNGAAWFCRSGPRRRDGVHEPCDLSDLRERFIDHDADRWANDWQGALIAAVVQDDGNGYLILGELRTVRGPFGRTNLGVYARDADKGDLPRLIAAHGWTWAEWTGKES